MLMRPFTWDDLPSLARIAQESAQADGLPSAVQAADVGEQLRQPNLKPLRDCFLAIEDGAAAGYVLLVEEWLLRRTIAEGAVLPSYRRRGIGLQLMAQAVLHSRRLQAERVQASAWSQEAARQGLFVKAGFVEVHRQWQLRMAMAEFRPGELSETYEPRHAGAEHIPYVTRMQNRSFRGSWGYAPNDPNELASRVQAGGGRFEDVLLLIVDGAPAAYCWTRVRRNAGERTGIVWMIGTDPDFQRRGLGRAVLAEAVADLRTRGASAVELTVNPENAAAIALYEDAGFKKRDEVIWYERSLTG